MSGIVYNLSEFSSSKGGARHSKEDSTLIQGIVNASKALGAGEKSFLAKVDENHPYSGLKTVAESIYMSGLALGGRDDDDFTKKEMAAKSLPYDRIIMVIRKAASKLLRDSFRLTNQSYDYYEDYYYPVEIYYPDYVICNCGISNLKIGFSIDEEAGTITFDPVDDWKRVILEWREASNNDLNAMKSIENVTERTKALKSVTLIDEEKGTVSAYACIWGDEKNHDISLAKDYFDENTDLWVDQWDKRPMIYDHGVNPALKSMPVVGTWTSFKKDDVGLFVEGELDQRHKYYQGVLKLIKKKALNLSSDSIDHLVQREAKGGGVHYLSVWPLAAISLTPAPAEPRLMGVGAIKSAYESAGLAVPVEIAKLALEEEIVALKSEKVTENATDNDEILKAKARAKLLKLNS